MSIGSMFQIARPTGAVVKPEIGEGGHVNYATSGLDIHDRRRITRVKVENYRR